MIISKLNSRSSMHCCCNRVLTKYLAKFIISNFIVFSRMGFTQPRAIEICIHVQKCIPFDAIIFLLHLLTNQNKIHNEIQ